MSDGFIYLAAPYSAGGADDDVMLKRFWQITAQAAILEDEGFVVYSPITSGRPLELCGLKLDHAGWLARDFEILIKAHTLFVMCLPGWGKSEGVRLEVEFAESHQIGVHYFEPDMAEIAERLKPLKKTHLAGLNLDDR